MKPKTKFQIKVAELSAQLPPITEEQIAWGYKYLDRTHVQSRKTISCLECGHSERTESPLWQNQLVPHTCKSCGITAPVIQHTRAYYQEAEYTAVLDTVGGLQVVRTIFVYKSMRRSKAARYSGYEVMQYWIDEDGNLEVMSLSCSQSNVYCDNWVYGSDMEIRGNLSNPRYRINPYKVHPKRKVLPILKRNGFNGHFYGIQPHKLFMALLLDTMSETLLKAKQISLFKWRAGRIFEAHNTLMMNKYFPIIKICIRNNYIVQDASLWEDYIRMLEWFGKDTRNPKYVCPPNLKEAHDRYMRKKEAIQKKKRDEERRNEMEQSNVTFIEQKKHFFGLTFSDGEITVKVLESVQEFQQEGEKLKHCVFTSEYYERQNSLILSARIDGEPIETIEVSLSTFEIEQSRGMNNKPSQYNERIVELVTRNMHEVEHRHRLSIQTLKSA